LRIKKDQGHRKGCDYVGNCHWGCHAKAIYSAADELPDLIKFNNFSYEPGLIVKKLEGGDDYWKVCGTEHSNVNRTISASKVVLAAGTLASTRLAFQALNFRETVSMLSCPSVAFLLWIPKFLGLTRQPGFAAGQLAHTLDVDAKTRIYGGTFASWGFPVSELIPHLPFSRPFGIDFLRGLLSSCLIGNAFLPSYLSNIVVTLDNENALQVTGATPTN
jgi:hypothetical protein